MAKTPNNMESKTKPKTEIANKNKKYVIELQHGKLTKPEFFDYLESKVFKTISKYKLVDKNDKICVAASGGKDSLTVLYLLKKYFQKCNFPKENLQALIIDEGIKDYRSKTLDDLKIFCKEHDVPLTIASFKKEYSKTLDEAYPIIHKKTKKKPCNICGVWRRNLLNTYAKKMGATKLATGHNLDDESQAVIMNIFKANTKLAAKLGPMSGIKAHDGFVRRIKPLYLCSEKETRLYTFLKGFKVNYTQCPNVSLSYRSQIRDMLNDFEAKYPGTKNGIIRSFLDLMPMLRNRELEKDQSNSIPKNDHSPKTGPLSGTGLETLPSKVSKKSACEPNSCQVCQEPSSGDTCNACKLKELIK